MKEYEVIGKCSYCKDPIYESGGMVVIDGEKYHANKDKLMLGQLYGCLNIKRKEDKSV